MVLTPWSDEGIERSNRDAIVRLAGVSVCALRETTPDDLAAAGAELPIEEWLS